VKKILGENEIESVLQRLDRLTLDEARTTAMQTLEIVHRLVQNMRVVIDGAATLPHFEARSLLIIPFDRWKGIGRRYFGCSKYVRLMRSSYQCLTA
jgi:hypothetical protein